MACVNGWHSNWRRDNRYPNGYFLERIYRIIRWAGLCRNAGKEVDQSMIYFGYFLFGWIACLLSLYWLRFFLLFTL